MIKYTHVEVRKAPKGWFVILFGKSGTVTKNDIKADNTLLGNKRLKRDAVLLGTGAAKALKLELRVTNRKGQYTDDAASFGHDPSNIPG